MRGPSIWGKGVHAADAAYNCVFIGDVSPRTKEHKRTKMQVRNKADTKLEASIKSIRFGFHTYRI